MTTPMTVYYPYKLSPMEYYVVELSSTNVKGAIIEPTVVFPEYSTGYIDVLLDLNGNPSFDGVVQTIRKYTYNFLGRRFETDVDDVETYRIRYEASETAYFEIIFVKFKNYVVKKFVPKVDTVPVQGEVGGSWDDDNATLINKQRDYFERTEDEEELGDDKVYEEIDAKIYRLTVYGSYDRALSEARLVIFPPPDKDPELIPENPEPEERYNYIIPGYPAGRIDAKLGLYRYYYPNGNLRKIENWANFTGLESRSVINGEYFEFYSDGKRKVEAGFNGGRMNGSYREYYNSGPIRCKCTLILGRLEGFLFQFDELGNRTYVARFVGGDLRNSYALDYTN